MRDGGPANGTTRPLLPPSGLRGGVTTLLLFLSHGASFPALRTKGDLHDRAQEIAKKLAPVAAGVVALFVVATLVRQNGAQGIEWLSALTLILAVVAAVAAVLRTGVSNGQAFGASAGTILFLFIGLFAELFPNAIVGRDGDPTLTLVDASSTPYTLKVMTVVAVIFVPIVLAYQAWTYWVFRARLGAEDFTGVHSPLDLIGERGAGGDAVEVPEGS